MSKVIIAFALSAFVCCVSTSTSAAVINFDLFGVGGAGLLPTNELQPTASTGVGGEIGTSGIQFDDVTKLLTVTVGWGSLRDPGFADLTGPVTAGHLHTAGAGNGINANGGVLQALTISDNSANNGLVNDVLTLNATEEALLLGGDTYLNFHTAANPAGELRGNLVVSAVPEPGSAAALAVLGLGVAIRRRKRS